MAKCGFHLTPYTPYGSTVNVNEGSYLQIMGKVQSDAAFFDRVTILEVTKEANSSVETSDDNHACVEYASPTSKILRRFHIVFKRKNLKMKNYRNFSVKN